MSEALSRPSIARVLVPGLRMGKFELREPLGRGGFGEVWKAHDTIERVDRALKVMLPSAFEQPGLVERFLREARVASRLVHPNVVRTFEPNQTDDGFVYLPMELMSGSALSDFMKERGCPIPLELVLRMMVPVLRGVGYLHGKGLVHRDLKPANVFLHRDPSDRDVVVPKVIDFGAVKVLDTEDDRSSTAAPSPMTLRYAAPEQLLCRKHEIDARTDVFALGVMLYEMLSRQRPFNATSTPEHFARAMSDVPVLSLREHVPGLPAAVDSAVLRCLARDRAQRPENAESLLEALLAAVGDEATEVVLTTAEVFPPEFPETEPPQRRAHSEKTGGDGGRPSKAPEKSATVNPTAHTLTVTIPRGGMAAVGLLGAGLCLGAGLLLWRSFEADASRGAARSPVVATVTVPMSSATGAAASASVAARVVPATATATAPPTAPPSATVNAAPTAVTAAPSAVARAPAVRAPSAARPAAVASARGASARPSAAPSAVAPAAAASAEVPRPAHPSAHEYEMPNL